MRAVLMAMSDELSRVTAYVSENLGSPGGLATMPAPAIAPPRPVRPALAPAGPATAPVRPAGPATRPDRPVRPAGPGTRPAGPATRPARPARPGTRPVGPATRPGARPGKSTGKPDTKGRQARVGKKMMAVLATVTAVGVIVGTAELALHGPAFLSSGRTARARRRPVSPITSSRAIRVHRHRRRPRRRHRRRRPSRPSNHTHSAGTDQVTTNRSLRNSWTWTVFGMRRPNAVWE